MAEMVRADGFAHSVGYLKQSLNVGLNKMEQDQILADKENPNYIVPEEFWEKYRNF